MQTQHHIAGPMPEPQSLLMAALKGKPAPIKPVVAFQHRAMQGRCLWQSGVTSAAAEAINMIEQQCGGGQLAGMMQTMPHGKQAAQSVLDPSLVCTVGTLSVWPGASNVIAGSTNFSVDIRQVNACLRKHMVHSHPRINLFACFQTSNTSWLSL